MPGNYDGRPAQITTESALTITSVSAANPAVVTVSGSLPAEFFTSGYAGLAAQPYVDITGVVGTGNMVNANGVFAASPTGASTFTIPVSTLGGAYSSGGTAQPLCIKSLYTLPVDGDADNSASIATWGQSTGDRTQWLAKSVGLSKLAGRAVLINPFGGGTWGGFSGSTIPSVTWAAFPFGVNFTTTAVDTGCLAINSVGTSAGHMQVASASGFITASDNVRVSIECNLSQVPSGAYFGLWYQFAAYGATAPTTLGTMTLLPASVRYLAFAGTNVITSVRSSGWLPHIGSGVLFIAFALYNSTLSSMTGVTCAAADDALLEWECHRLTGMPQ